MIPYIGCVSKEDAHLLARLAAESHRILEFGSGASTQIFAAYTPGHVYSVETDDAWIVKTRGHLDGFGTTEKVSFHRAEAFEPGGQYDLVFVDGIDDDRLVRALSAWKCVAWRGVMAFHDTRRTEPHGASERSDIANVASLLQWHSTEIDRIDVNAEDSNTTLVYKRVAPLLYVDWQVTEGRTDAQMGLG